MRSWRLGMWLSACLASSACSATEGNLFVSRTDAGETAPLDAAADAATDAAAPSVVRPGMRLQYQLTGTLDQNADAELFVVDLFDTTPAQIAALHAGAKVVVAYISAGSSEPWRLDVNKLPAAVIGNPLAGYPEERWLDVRAPSVRQLLDDRLARAAEKGFDGVLLVSLDGYLANTGHDLSADDQLAYNLWLAERASQRGLAAGLTSAWPLASQLAERYAFAIHLNVWPIGAAGELDAYRTRGRAVFDLETGTTDNQRICTDASALSLPVTLKRDTFDAWLYACR